MSLHPTFLFLFFVYATIAIAESTLTNSQERQGKIQENVKKESMAVNSNGPGVKLPIKGHVLFYHVVGTVSHINFAKALIEDLLSHGHSVTSAFYHPTKIIHENYTEILIEDQTEELYNALSLMFMGTWSEVFQLFRDYDSSKENSPDYQKIVGNSVIHNIEQLKSINETKKFDLVVNIAAASSSMLAHIFDTPLVTLSAGAPLSVLMEGLGDPMNPMNQPTFMSPFIEPMTFWERLGNLIILKLWKLSQDLADNRTIKLVSEHLGIEIPDKHTIMQQRHVLGLVNSHFVTHGVWPSYKNLVEIGGIHCKPAKPLSGELKKYMDSHNEGVVYVSFGSALKPSRMSFKAKQIFHESFKQLNIPIIWKWDSDNTTGIPDNVKIVKWVPQNDLLAHPNLKVFVTHGGLLSTQETLYHKVPIVGIPLGLDQKTNIMRAERNGFGIKLGLNELNKEELVSSIKKAMHDPNIKKSINLMHTLFTENHGKTPGDRAVAAMEFVLKYKNSDILQPNFANSIPWYAFYGYDILMFLICVTLSVSFIVFKAVFLCIRIWGKRKTKQD